MTIQFMSDLHLEFKDNLQYINSLDIPITGDILILAGDTGYLRDTNMPKLKFWKWASKNYREVLLIPGNHEFYNNGDVLANGDSWNIMIGHNVGYYQNRVVRLDDTDIILSTLWSHIPPTDEYLVSRRMNDFYQIMYDGRRFRTSDFNVEHDKCLSFIKNAVEKSDAEKIVVVTHHLPSYSVVAPCYVGDSLTSAFATELGDYIADSRINAWIFGHSHTNIDNQIGGTKLVCNQLGYVGHEGDGYGFDPEKFFEI